VYKPPAAAARDSGSGGASESAEARHSRHAAKERASAAAAAAVCSAAYFGTVDGLEAALRRGGSVSSRDETGMTPLHWAAHGGHGDVAQALLQRGSDLSATNRDGWTPLHFAACAGHVGMVKQLLSAGAVADAPNAAGRTPLQVRPSRASRRSAPLRKLRLTRCARRRCRWRRMRTLRLRFATGVDAAFGLVIKQTIVQLSSAFARISRRAQALVAEPRSSGDVSLVSLLPPLLCRVSTPRAEPISLPSRASAPPPSLGGVRVTGIAGLPLSPTDGEADADGSAPPRCVAARPRSACSSASASAAPCGTALLRLKRDAVGECGTVDATAGSSSEATYAAACASALARITLLLAGTAPPHARSADASVA
jgi:hypothetical protein